MSKTLLIVFVIVTLASGWLGLALDRAAGMDAGQGPGMLIWILLPAVTAALLRWIAGLGWADAGLKPNFRGNGRFYALSLLFYPVAACITVAIGAAVGGIDFSFERVGAFWREMGMIILISQIWTNVFEEFAFRGFLAPKSDEVMGTLLSYLFTGLVWGAWHLPYLKIITSFSAVNGSVLILLFLLSAVFVSLVYGEVRKRSASMWPAVLMQVSGGLAFGLAAGGARMTEGAWFFSPAFDGGVVVILCLCAGLYLVRARLSGKE